MRKFRLANAPIKTKLLVIIMATTTAALVVAGGGIVAVDYALFRGYIARDLTATARIIADSSTAALAFDDPKSAAETLGTLRARTHLVNACIFRADGTVLANYVRPGAPPTCPQPQAEGLRFGEGGVTVSREIRLQGSRLGTLVFVYDLGEIAERFKLYGSAVLCVLLASGLVALLVASWLRVRITTPIALLVRATTDVSEKHDYSVRAVRQSGDELGLLVDRFNEMLAGIQSRDDTLTKALQEREEALRDAERARERFRFMAESMPQKIWTARPDGEIDYFNQRWTQFTGLSFDQIRGWGWTQFIHPADLDENLKAWRRSLETGEALRLEHRFRDSEGHYRWHLTRGEAMRDPQGNVSMWIGSSTDIDEQKEKEEELRRANDDLQQFAYSASHDLQEPIRNVTVYSEIISRRYHSLLDAEGRQFLGFLIEGGRRLATLIRDLLDYTRAGMAESSGSLLDSSEAMQNTVSSLAEAIRETGATVTHGTLPEVYMSEAHLQQVFLNLISNALKYHGSEPPRIHIAAVRQGLFWRFSVEDNGIGIDPQYKEKIFGVFKRLHRDEKYSGTGIGLAICQRVVQRYGGRIWVESTPGEGSTFFFTIPEHAG